MKTDARPHKPRDSLPITLPPQPSTSQWGWRWPPGGRLAESGDISVTTEGGATGIGWAEAGGATPHPTTQNERALRGPPTTWVPDTLGKRTKAPSPLPREECTCARAVTTLYNRISGSLVTPRPVVVHPSIPEEIPALLCCWSRRHSEAPALQSALRALLAFLLSNHQAQWESDRQVLCEREGFEVNTSALPCPPPPAASPCPSRPPFSPWLLLPLRCEASALEQRQLSEAGRAHRWVAVPMSQAVAGRR